LGGAFCGHARQNACFTFCHHGRRHHRGSLRHHRSCRSLRQRSEERTCEVLTGSAAAAPGIAAPEPDSFAGPASAARSTSLARPRGFARLPDPCPGTTPRWGRGRSAAFDRAETTGCPCAHNPPGTFHFRKRNLALKEKHPAGWLGFRNNRAYEIALAAICVNMPRVNCGSRSPVADLHSHPQDSNPSRVIQ
jgi:hypothetical protein